MLLDGCGSEAVAVLTGVAFTEPMRGSDSSASSVAGVASEGRPVASGPAMPGPAAAPGAACRGVSGVVGGVLMGRSCL